jgi:glycosyltransferase involved in cell wall biosynthesis
MMKRNLYWRALSKSRADGYGYASYRISSGLRDAGLPVFEPEDFLCLDKSVSNVFVSMAEGVQLIPDVPASDDDILVNNCLPNDYKLGDCYNIGFSYWETNALPSNWVRHVQNCDEVWTTSSWAKSVFEDSTGHDNVHSFRLGIESDIFYKSDSVPDGPFTFLHVGSPSTRKNTQMAVNAFMRTYGHRKDFRLIVKSMGPPDARIRDSGMNHGAIMNHDRIQVIDYEVSEDELADIYRSAHCLLYPTMGEGWGMIPFDSIACGTPTICTNATSCTEYASLSVPLDFEWSNEGMSGIYSGCGTWAKPNIDDLVDKMHYVVNNYEEVKHHTLKGATIIHKEYSWSSVVQEYKDRLCQI